MTWIEASLLSAVFLGVYDLCIKHAIRDNAVLPILFFSSLTGATVWTALLLVQSAQPGLLPASLVTDHLTVGQHLQLLLKSAIVAASWVFTYFGLKHLPLSLGAPIRATTPLWTLGGAAAPPYPKKAKRANRFGPPVELMVSKSVFPTYQ